MFGRLNPTKPPAAHRAILERVGMACRELRPIADAATAADQLWEQATQVFVRHGVLGIGSDAEHGGAGTDPLLVAMAAERIGREGSGPVHVFALNVASPGTTSASEVGIPQMLGSYLALAGGAVGVLADCLDTVAEFAVKRIKMGDAVDLRPGIPEHIAETACDLEAARALVYAAAELKTEFDRRPDSEHLGLEARTLVSQAKLFATAAVDRMFGRMNRIEIGGEPLRACLPPRHRLAPRDALELHESSDVLAAQIARFYLFE